MVLVYGLRFSFAVVPSRFAPAPQEAPEGPAARFGRLFGPEPLRRRGREAAVRRARRPDQRNQVTRFVSQVVLGTKIRGLESELSVNSNDSRSDIVCCLSL